MISIKLKPQVRSDEQHQMTIRFVLKSQRIEQLNRHVYRYKKHSTVVHYVLLTIYLNFRQIRDCCTNNLLLLEPYRLRQPLRPQIDLLVHVENPR